MKDISSLDPDKLRSDLEHQLAEWSNLDRGTAEEQQVAQETWRKYELLTSSLSQELCEQLRLVLEPSLATKLKYVISMQRALCVRATLLFILDQKFVVPKFLEKVAKQCKEPLNSDFGIRVER